VSEKPEAEPSTESIPQNGQTGREQCERLVNGAAAEL
jgi:hypothetical protein